MKIELNNFTPVYDSMIQALGLLTANIYGRIERLSWLHGYCYANQETIGDLLGISRQTVNKHVKILIDEGYVQDLDPDLRNKAHRLKPTGKARVEMRIDGIDDGVNLIDSKNGGVKEIDTGVNEIDTTSSSGVNLIDMNKESLNKEFKENINPISLKTFQAFDTWKSSTLRDGTPKSTFDNHVKPLELISFDIEDPEHPDNYRQKANVVLRCKAGDLEFVQARFINPKGNQRALAALLGYINLQINLTEATK